MVAAAEAAPLAAPAPEPGVLHIDLKELVLSIGGYRYVVFAIVLAEPAEIAGVTVRKWSCVRSVDLVGSRGEVATVASAFV